VKKSLVFTIGLIGSLAARGGTIINVSGPQPFGFSGQTNFVFGWNQTTSYSNVSGSMPLADLTAGGPVGGVEGTIYFVNQIGPGTTAANQIVAPISISGLTGSFVSTPLFSGLTLGPGNYYLVLVPTGTTSGLTMSPQAAAPPVVVVGSGVTDLGAGIAGTVNAYPPASIVTLSAPNPLFVNVTGDAAAIPEPSALSMAALGIAALMLWRSRRRTKQPQS
jgi:hypothetical protein